MKKLLPILFMLSSVTLSAQRNIRDFCVEHGLALMAEDTKGKSLVKHTFDVRFPVMMKPQVFTFEAVYTAENGKMSLKSLTNTQTTEGSAKIDPQEYGGVFKTNLSKAQWEKLVGAAKSETDKIINAFNN